MASDTDNLKSITKLVSGFRENLTALRDPQTSEAVIRQEYIDPFWVALGWDVANKDHRSHAEKDVLIEAPVGTIEGERVRNRRPDYLFRIDGFPRFVVEAKKPAVDLRTDKESIFQAKTYAWSAQIPFAILTNFEEFRLFDTTIKPYLEEPGRGLIEEFDLRFEDFVTQWDVLWQTFSREAVAGGSLERLLAKLKKVRAGRRIRGFDRMLFDLRGTEPVDQVFLKHLEDYRLRFAREIYQENRSRFREAETHHGAAELAEATQRLIDRLVFMRVCEDRGIIALRHAARGRGRRRQAPIGPVRRLGRAVPRVRRPLQWLPVQGPLQRRTWLFPLNCWPISSDPSISLKAPTVSTPSATTCWGSFTSDSSAAVSPWSRGNVEAKPKPEVLHAERGVLHAAIRRRRHHPPRGRAEDRRQNAVGSARRENPRSGVRLGLVSHRRVTNT